MIVMSKPFTDEHYAEVGGAATGYMKSLWADEGTEAREYLLEDRGLDESVVQSFGLGYVHEPAHGHGPYRGRVSIPYANNTGVSTLRFRGLPGNEGKAKYLDLPGARSTMFNITALNAGGATLYICEGEIDTMTATQMGLPAVGLSGVQKWQSHYRSLLAGYNVIRVLCDSDDSGVGLEMGNAIKSAMADRAFVQLMPAPEGHDVNSAFMEMGTEALLEYWDIDLEEEA